MAEYTEYFADYLKDNSLPEVLGEMPDDDSGTSFKDRFVMRNLYKEIGTETEELFRILLESKAYECVNRYKFKIQEYIDHRDHLLDRFIELEETSTAKESQEAEHAENGSLTGDYSLDGSGTKTSAGTSEDDNTITDKDEKSEDRTINTTTSETGSSTDTTADEQSTTTHQENDGTDAHHYTYLNPIDADKTMVVDSATEDVIDPSTTLDGTGTLKDDKTETITNTKSGEVKDILRDELIDNRSTTGHDKRTTSDEESTSNTEQRGTEEATSNEGTSSYTIERNASRTHQELYRAYKGMPEMIDLTNKLEVLYEVALASMDVLFMGVL